MVFRALVISDVHANFVALQAVLADAEKHGPYDALLNAGDLVGYGPDPNECVEAIKERGFVSVLGNHDRVVRREHSTGTTARFNPYAREAAHYNRDRLTPESREFLAGLTNEPYFDPGGRFAMVHGSFAGSSSGRRYEDVYIFEDFEAADAMRCLFLDDDTSETGYRHVKLGMVGHTHVPTYAKCWIGYGYQEDGEDLEFVAPISASPIEVNFGDEPAKPLYQNVLRKPKALFNPGSVGQPRDGDSRASYGIVTFDDDRIILEVRRVEYDITETQRRMKAARLPQHLIDRLAVGR